MSDGDALLAAILANPDDDTPRLVYADWLQENGNEPWARFIRWQIDGKYPAQPPLTSLIHLEEFMGRQPHEMHRYGFKGKAEVKRYPTAVVPHRPRPEMEKQIELTFRRGFVDWVRMDHEQFVIRCGDLFRWHPVRRVERWHSVGQRLDSSRGWVIPQDSVPSVLWCPELDRQFRNYAATIQAYSDVCVRFGRSATLTAA